MSAEQAFRADFDEDCWDDPEAEYAEETEVCRHGIPFSAECEWCEQEEGEY